LEEIGFEIEKKITIPPCRNSKKNKNNEKEFFFQKISVYLWASLTEHVWEP